MRVVSKLFGAILILGLFTSSGRADVILDPQEVAKVLAEIARSREDANNAASVEARMQSLFKLGEQVLYLTNLMTTDLQTHGFSDSIVNVIMRRLRDNGVNIWLDSQLRSYQYDMATFREYLAKAPRGKYAADARFLLIEYKPAGDDISQLQQSIREKNQFLRTYPRHSRVSRVNFLLAQDHLRLSHLYSWQKNSVLSAKHEQIARGLFEQIIKLYPRSAEANNTGVYLFKPRPPE
jgi:tetratricopeptide (TPR) repeat protein